MTANWHFFVIRKVPFFVIFRAEILSRYNALNA